MKLHAVPLALLDHPHADEELAGIALAALSVLLHDDLRLMGTASHSTLIHMVVPALSVEEVVETARQLEPQALKDVLYTAWRSEHIADDFQGADPTLPTHRARKVISHAAPFAVELAECILNDDPTSHEPERRSLTPVETLQQLLFVVSTTLHASKMLLTSSSDAVPSAGSKHMPLMSRTDSLLHATAGLQKRILSVADATVQPPAVQLSDSPCCELMRAVQITCASVVALARFLAAAQHRDRQPTADSVTAGVLTASQGECVLQTLLVMMEPEMSGKHKHDFMQLNLLGETATQPDSSITATAAVISRAQLAVVA